MKKIMSTMLAVILLFSTVSVVAFSDVSAVPWAQDSIDRLASMYVINGYEDGSFRPYNNVTRGEFAKMLCLAFDLNWTVSDVDFGDVANHWAYDYIVRTIGYVCVPASDYEPDRSATRAEIAYALAKVLSLGESDEDMTKRYSDWDTIDEEIAKFVASSVTHGIIQGYETVEIKGDNPVTRAEAAVLIARAMDYKASTPQNPAEDEDEEPSVPEEPPYSDPELNPDDDIEADDKNDIFAGLDDIYTRYPYEDLFIISDVATVISDKTEDVVYKLTYKIAGGNSQEYTSVIEDCDRISVLGCKTDFDELEAGDVFIIDMVFLTQINKIYVLASMDSDVETSSGTAVIPALGRKLGAYESGADYEFLHGVLLSKSVKTNVVTIEVKNNNGTYTVNVPRTVKADFFNLSKRNPSWETKSVSSLDYSGNTIVYVRLKDGRVTEVVAAEY